MKLPDAVIDKLQDGESPVTRATMFHYTPETYLDWFRSMMNEMNPGKGSSTKKNKVKLRKKRPTARASRSHRAHSRKRESRRRG